MSETPRVTKKVLYLRVPETLHDTIAEMAAAQRRTIASMTQILLEDALAPLTRYKEDQVSG